MSDLVSYIVKQLVNHPDDVSVDEQNNQGQVNLTLSVNPEDMGIVIGKGGQTIKSIRKILTTRAIVDRVRVNLQLNEPAGGRVDSAKSAPIEEQSTESAESENSEGPEETQELIKE